MWGKGRGDRILEAARGGDPEVAAWVAARRAEGVLDEDIRWMWNQSDAAMKKTDEMSMTVKATLYLWSKDETGDEQKAIDFANRNWPFYGDPAKPEGIHQGEDRPLFPELHHRIDSWSARQGWGTAKPRMEAAMAGHATMNSLIRAEMRAGRL